MNKITLLILTVVFLLLGVYFLAKLSILAGFFLPLAMLSAICFEHKVTKE